MTNLAKTTNEERERHAREMRARGMTLTQQGWQPLTETEASRRANDIELHRLLNELDL